MNELNVNMHRFLFSSLLVVVVVAVVAVVAVVCVLFPFDLSR